jgi:hypothetical protein
MAALIGRGESQLPVVAMQQHSTLAKAPRRPLSAARPEWREVANALKIPAIVSAPYRKGPGRTNWRLVGLVPASHRYVKTVFPCYASPAKSSERETVAGAAQQLG